MVWVPGYIRGKFSSFSEKYQYAFKCEVEHLLDERSTQDISKQIPYDDRAITELLGNVRVPLTRPRMREIDNLSILYYTWEFWPVLPMWRKLWVWLMMKFDQTLRFLEWSKEGWSRYEIMAFQLSPGKLKNLYEKWMKRKYGNVPLSSRISKTFPCSFQKIRLKKSCYFLILMRYCAMQCI